MRLITTMNLSSATPTRAAARRVRKLGRRVELRHFAEDRAGAPRVVPCGTLRLIGFIDIRIGGTAWRPRRSVTWDGHHLMKSSN
jgi:hypothetical protein